MCQARKTSSLYLKGFAQWTPESTAAWRVLESASYQPVLPDIEERDLFKYLPDILVDTPESRKNRALPTRHCGWHSVTEFSKISHISFGLCSFPHLRCISFTVDELSLAYDFLPRTDVSCIWSILFLITHKPTLG